MNELKYPFDSDFILKRSSLEKLVGDKTLKEFEANLENRYK